MLFKGTLVGPASGSIAGSTASHNRGGQYFRVRATPVNPNTSRQQAIRSYLTVLTARWRDVLTSNQRNGWNEYAENTPLTNALGDARNAGGLGMYLRGNVPRLLASLAVVDEGPATSGFPTFLSPTVNFTSGTNDASIAFSTTDAWRSQTGAAMLLFVGGALPASINYFKGPYQYIGRILGNTTTPPTSPQTLSITSFTVKAASIYPWKINVVGADARYSGEFLGKSSAA